MIEESYISFDTAKLLKEAGFDLSCRGVYVTDRTGYYEFREYDNKQTTDDLCWNTEDGFQYEYLAPTQALAARWLREVYGFCISVDYWKPDDALFYCNITQFRYGTHRLRKIYSSYEEALEDGIQDCLKRINR